MCIVKYYEKEIIVNNLIFFIIIVPIMIDTYSISCFFVQYTIFIGIGF